MLDQMCQKKGVWYPSVVKFKYTQTRVLGVLKTADNQGKHYLSYHPTIPQNCK